MGCKKPRKKWTGGRIEIKEPFNLRNLVEDYLKTPYECKYSDHLLNNKDGHECYLDSLKSTIDFIFGEPGNKPEGPYFINGHQRFFRFPSRRKSIQETVKTLENSLSNQYDSFEELYNEVDGLDLYGFGDTTTYDYALRYGWSLNPKIQPQKEVYVHSKPREAALYLREKNYIKKDFGRTIPIENLPDEIKNSAMSAADIEHFLCCYKEYIEKLPENKKLKI